jgi:anti-anti-sigma factor
MTLKGDLNIYNAGKVKGKLFEKLRDSEVLNVSLNKIEEFDTAGMQVLLLAKKFAQQSGVSLHIKDQSHTVSEVLQLYNVDI